MGGWPRAMGFSHATRALDSTSGGTTRRYVAEQSEQEPAAGPDRATILCSSAAGSWVRVRNVFPSTPVESCPSPARYSGSGSVGQDGRTYETVVEATSLFDAADRALQQWARLWWYRPNGFVEVRMGDKCWR